MRPLIYVELLATKQEAARAIKKVIAQARHEHGGFPVTLDLNPLFTRLHSDQGGEFMSEDLCRLCEDNGIHKTSTQGYDPSANGNAEGAVGAVKRRCRYLLRAPGTPRHGGELRP